MINQEGYVYTSYGKYTTSEYKTIEEAYKYARLSDIENVNKILSNNSDLFKPINLHFLYNILQEEFYKKRNDEKYLNLALEICLKDYELLKQELLPDIIKSATLPCINRLAIIYEKKNMIAEAIEVLRFAVDNQFNGNYSSKLSKLLNNTNIEKIEKRKRIIEIYNEQGLCKKESKLIEIISNELTKRNLKTKFIPFIKSTGYMAIRFTNCYITNVKIRNNTDEYFQAILSKVPEWISFVEMEENSFNIF